MRSSSNNNIAEQSLRVPGGTGRQQEKKLSKTAGEEALFLSTELISEL